MRLSPYALSALAANLVAALPRPQSIDLDMVFDTPDPTFSEAIGAAAQTVTYDTASIIAEATAAVSSVSILVSDVLSATAVVSQLKRGEATTCVPQPSGATSAPTYAPGADTDNASLFLANNYYASVASAAPTPSGYSQVFVNQQASNNAFGYLGFDTFDTYDVATCASRCSAKDGCVSINMYFERDPSVDPNDASCSNPTSVTMIKCVYWGGPVSLDSAVNKGQMRGGFTVAIAGSNGYVTNQIKTPAGYQSGVAYGKFAINAPYDAQGYNTFMGSKLFTSTWDAASCAAYCDSQTKYNLATAPKDGTPAKVCNFFNTYVLTAHKADGSVVPQGQYCALYTEAWTSTQATNGGQWRGQDQYVVNYSFGYAKLSAGIVPTAGDVTGAVYQARQDMTYFPSSLTSVFRPFCSSLLMYTAPVVSVTASTTTTPTALTTVVVTSTLAANAKRAAASSLSVPAVLTKYPSAVIASACGLIATSPTVTSTVTAATATVTAAASISTYTLVSTVAPAPAVATPPTILNARFADQDVTNAAKAAFMQNGNIVIDLSNVAGSVGGDPRWLTTKTLDVLYSVNGQMYVFTGYDFEGVYTITTTSQPNSEPVAGVNAPTGGSGCDIIAIAYGNGQAPKTTDSGNVYNTFKAACDNAASYTVDYNDFGFDNMGGRAKTAVFWYYQNGVLTSKAAWDDENNVINFAPTAKPQAPIPPSGNYCQGKPSFFLQATGPGTNVDQQFGWVSGGVNIYFQQQSSSSATVMCFDANNHVYAGWNGHVLVRHTDPSDYFIGFVPQSDAHSYDIATCGIVDGHFWCQGDERNINQVNSNQEWFSGSDVSSGNSAIMIYGYAM